MKKHLPIARPTQPAAACVKCQSPRAAQQDRVVHNHQVSLFVNAAPLFNAPFGTEEIRLQDCWFYISLHVPVQPVLRTLEAQQLPWLCPRCAGYPTASNIKAPGATILTDKGQQRATGAYSLYDMLRHEQGASQPLAISSDRFREGARSSTRSP